MQHFFRSSVLALSSLTLVACAADMEATGGTAHVRVAHLSPTAPRVDFCVASHGTSEWIGPVLATNGVSSGLAYGSATKYLDLPADQYDVRLVEPGAADCTTPLGGLADFTNLPALASDSFATLAAEGLVEFGSATPLVLRPYIDDMTVAAGQAKLRFVHASPGTPSVDVGLGGGALFGAVFSDVAYGDTAAANNGYVQTSPLAGVEISARAHGTATDALSIKPAVLPDGAIATAFAIGRLGDATTPLRVLLCVDNAAPNGLLAQCNVVGGTPSRAHVRFAHLSPDLRAVDVCLAPAGTDRFSPPVLASLGVQDGLTYAAVTAYVDVPVGAWDVRVIIANATGCSIPAIPDTKGVTVVENQTATVAALGDSDTSGLAANDPALHLQLFTDVTTVAAGQAKVRFIHASPGTPAVDVGLGSGASFTKVFANVAFGNVATNAGIDVLGFVQTHAPLTSAVSARVAGSSSDALTTQALTFPDGAAITAFAIGGKTGASTNPLQVLVCVDNAAPNGLASACQLVN